MIAATGWQALYALPTESYAGDPRWTAWDTRDHVRLDVVMWEEVRLDSSTPIIAGWVVRPDVVGLLAGYLAQAPDVTCVGCMGAELSFVQYIRATDEVTYSHVEGASQVEGVLPDVRLPGCSRPGTDGAGPLSRPA